ncbi:thiamine pyrophosphate-binding protein [Falsiroseomonas sp. CW058]|uniref:thiamine pyrophosphate-binding protein n=1 Tax=Falsiroseomonas sp. CW058 TaxID=3388664 RepID=UPI003D323034
MAYTVGDLVAEFLAAAGVTTAFGIVSIHNIPVLDAIGRRNAIRFVPARGEMGGGHMADAHARATGGLGVLVTSTGPGAANAVPALVEARFAGSPLLHVTGQTATRLLGRDTGAVHDVPGQGEMLAAVCKSVHRVRVAEEAFGVLLAAAADALSAPMGPVTIEIPTDLQRAAVARPAALDRLVLPVRPAPLPAAAELDALAEMLAAARRPMLWLGNGAKGAAAEARALADLGFGIVTSWNGRGTVPDDHPMSFGALHGNDAPLVERFYEGVDAMVVVGSRLRGHETLDGALKLPRNLVQVDVDPRAAGRTYPSAQFVAGDAAAVLGGLARRLGGRLGIEPGFAAELARTRDAARAAYRDTLGPYADFPAQLRAAMPRDALWVRDATVAGATWAHRLVPVHGPRDSIHPVGAAIGPGLPFGIGAALAAGPAGRKTVMMAGDGGFAMNMSELFTATQERAELCCIVMNDGIYAAIGHIQDAFQDGRRFFGELRHPDLQALAALAGIPAWRVDRADAFGETVARALATPGPTLVEVDMRAIGPVPSYGPYAKRRSA